MNRIDELLDEISGQPDRWTDEAPLVDEVWGSVRNAAGRCLSRMPAEPGPPPEESHPFVPEDPIHSLRCCDEHGRICMR